MAKIIAYIRTLTDKQDLNNQKIEIFEFAEKINWQSMILSKRRFQVEKRAKSGE